MKRIFFKTAQILFFNLMIDPFKTLFNELTEDCNSW